MNEKDAIEDAFDKGLDAIGKRNLSQWIERKIRINADDEKQEVRKLTLCPDMSMPTSARCEKMTDAHLRPLANLPNLEYLDLNGNRLITNLTPLAGLGELKKLYLGNNAIANLTPLVGLNKLKTLDLNNNEISDLGNLSDLKQLEKLNLSDNQNLDLASLPSLLELKELRLENNEISDLSPLSGLAKLEELYLNCNQIEDLTPLMEIGNLESVELKGNSYLPKPQIDKLQKSLPKCKISHDYEI